MRTSGFKTRHLFFTAIAALTAASTWAVDLAREMQFEIPSQSLGAALLRFSSQAGVQVLTAGEKVSQTTSPGVRGRYSIESGLKQILAGTGFEFKITGKNTVSIVQVIREDESVGLASGPPVVLAQTNQIATDETKASPSDANAETSGTLEEVVVTGSHIRGAAHVGSPLITVSRDEIEINGYTQAQQILSALPQNFGGGSAEGVAGTPGRESSLNAGGGQGANLRGLGSGSTLVLLNGHRLAPAGYGNFIDISLLPVTAIERVEVITDGASAIYGADAVGGVVNFILRENFQGAESKLRFGAATQGGAGELSAAQTFGINRGSVNAILSYEHYDRHRLPSAKRSFSASALQPQDLLPGVDRDSMLLAVEGSFSERLRGDVQALLSDNRIERYDFFGASARISADTAATQVNAGLSLDLHGDWQARLAGGYGRTKVDVDRISLLDGANNPARNTSRLASAEITADGSLFKLPAGFSRAALGAGWRHEDFVEGVGSFLSGTDAARAVASAFVELTAPLIDFIDDETALGSLVLNVAGRYEDYSDFGDVFTPKLGIDLSLARALKLRGTYSKAFKAPIFFDMSPEDRFPQLFWIDDPIIGSPSLLLYDSGSNEDLRAERAKVWTAGADVRFGPGTLSLTYFDIAYDDRIIEPVTDVFAVLAQEDVYRDLIDRAPDPALLTQLGSLPGFVNFTTFPGFGPPVDDAALATLLIDGRIQNVATTDISGLDVLASRSVETRAGVFGVRVNGTCLFEQKQRITRSAPSLDVVDTAFNPLRYRTATQLSWSRGDSTVSLLWNYANSYRRTADAGADPVESWSTLDVGMRHDFSSGVISGLAVTANVRNVFDSNPPAVSGLLLFNDYGYDPTNASPIGRFVSVELKKSW